MREHARSLGYQPKVEVLETGDDHTFGTAEQRWIQHYTAAGYKLRNIHPGGAGGTLGVERRISEKGKIGLAKNQFKPGRIMSAAAEAKRITGVQAWWAAKTPEERRAMASARTQKRLACVTKEQLQAIGRRVTDKREQRRRAGIPIRTNSEFMKALLATPEAKRVLSQRFKELWADKSPEEKAAQLVRMRQGRLRRKNGEV